VIRVASYQLSLYMYATHTVFSVRGTHPSYATTYAQSVSPVYCYCCTATVVLYCTCSVGPEYGYGRAWRWTGLASGTPAGPRSATRARTSLVLHLSNDPMALHSPGTPALFIHFTPPLLARLPNSESPRLASDLSRPLTAAAAAAAATASSPARCRRRGLMLWPLFP
jgi:hypothetical protein